MEVSYGVYFWYGRYICAFYIDGKYDYDVRGSNGTGVKHYDTREQAEAAGRRYLKRMRRLGFN